METYNNHTGLLHMDLMIFKVFSYFYLKDFLAKLKEVKLTFLQKNMLKSYHKMIVWAVKHSMGVKF